MKNYTLSLAVIFLLAGCTVFGFKQAWVTVVIENQSSAEIDNARIRFGDYVCSGGFVGIGGGKGNVDYPYPITEATEIHWDVGGMHKQQNVNLRGIYKRGQSGTLTYTILDNGVQAKFKEEAPPAP